MFKNVATKIAVFAFDTTTGVPKTGDAANITAYVSKDYGAVTVLADTTATEMDATNAKGWYLFDVAQAETNADALLFSGKSVTANISVVAQYIFTTPNRFSSLVIDAAGLADANMVKSGPTGSGTAQTARDLGGQLDATVSSRMATYTQPTGFLAATFPTGTVANTTNITAATVTAATVSDKTGYALTAGERTTLTGLVWDVAIAGHLTAGTTGAKLNSASAAGDPWGTALPASYAAGTAGYILAHVTGSAGAGAITWAYVLTNSITTLPIADATVWVTSDSAGNNVLASGLTDAFGSVTFFLDAGTVYVWRQKSGFNFVNPDVEVVS